MTAPRTHSLSPLSIGSTDLLENDTNIDGDILTVPSADAALNSVHRFSFQDFSLTIATTNGGTVEVFREGTYTYSPATGFVGTDSFACMVADDSGHMDG